MPEKEKRTYYDWQGIFSRQTNGNGSMAMVVSQRGLGKTYGIRKHCILEYLRHGKRFVEVVRHEAELKGQGNVAAGYFDKLVSKGEFAGYIFKTVGTRGYIAKEPEDEDEKPKWQEFVYFVSLSRMQNAKKMTFADVGSIIFDEFVIDRRVTSARYLNGEYDLLMEMVNTIIREEPGKPSDAKIYLLGNSLNFATCPYFQEFGMVKVPGFGYHWLRNKKVLLHYVNPDDYEARDSGLMGALASSRSRGAMFENTFKEASDSYVVKPGPNMRHNYNLIFLGRAYAVYTDWDNGYMFIQGKEPTRLTGATYALTKEDGRIDWFMVKKTSRVVKTLVDMYYSGFLRYGDVVTKAGFMKMLSFLGVS